MINFASRLGAIVGLITATLAVQPARAQIIAGPGVGTKPQQKSTAQPAPPPALPGARVEKEMVAPPARVMSDMPPNDALFDSINRGDIASARDAISRGADLGARNLLGMTPLELSVDLGRNDISFLLLSYRDGGNAGSHPPPPTKTAEVKPKTPARTAKTSPAAAKDHATAADQASAPSAPKAPRLFAGDGGAPVPAAGFLGFGGGNSATR